jgi:nodulation protein F
MVRRPLGTSAGPERRTTGRPGESGFPEEDLMTDQIDEDVLAKIKAHADPKIGDITPETELTSLGIHSLELTEIIFDIEEAYGIEIEMNTVEAWSHLSTIGDLTAAVRTLLEQKKA